MQRPSAGEKGARHQSPLLRRHVQGRGSPLSVFARQQTKTKHQRRRRKQVPAATGPKNRSRRPSKARALPAPLLPSLSQPALLSRTPPLAAEEAPDPSAGSAGSPFTEPGAITGSKSNLANVASAAANLCVCWVEGGVLDVWHTADGLPESPKEQSTRTTQKSCTKKRRQGTRRQTSSFAQQRHLRYLRLVQQVRAFGLVPLTGVQATVVQVRNVCP